MNPALSLKPALLLALLSCAVAASAQDTGLQRCRAVAEATARLACYDALADSRPKAPAPPAAPVAAAPTVKPPDSFGLPQPMTEPQALRSSVGADFAGWGPNQTIKLANGQVWQIVDGSSVSLPRGARAVSVRRGLFGAYHLDIEGLNTSPKVKRLE